MSAAVGTVLLLILIAIRNRAETTVAGLAGWLPFGYAFAAGMVASVNPCGFFMLPAYLSYQLGARGQDAHPSPTLVRTGRVLLLGTTATAGFLGIMAAVGLVIAAGGQGLLRAFPYAGVLIGVLLTALGLWLLLTGRSIGLLSASRVTITPQRNLRHVFMFGVAYAIGSLSCTLPIFLLVVGSSLATTELAASFGQFISFGLGMGAILVAVTIGAAFFQDRVARSLRAIVPHVHRVSALFLIGAGLYLVYYWVWFSGFIL
ncbi:MAG: cytochrome c biogenesis CcdA family protein [bacterium]